jgi:hypothetical protein
MSSIHPAPRNASAGISFAVSALVLLILSIVMLAATGERAPALEVILSGEQPIVLVYEQPEAKSDISVLLERGTRVQVIDYSPDLNADWARIQYRELSGWVSIEFLALEP